MLLRAAPPSRVPARPPRYVAAALDDAPSRNPAGPHLAVARDVTEPEWLAADAAVVEVFVPRLLARLRHGSARLGARYALARLEACLEAGRPAPVFFRPSDAPALLVRRSVER
ncbi:MAG: hypothetical protein D6705_12815, partial [Deltaproteobacteria bacterium]